MPVRRQRQEVAEFCDSVDAADHHLDRIPLWLMIGLPGKRHTTVFHSYTHAVGG
jgi:hypothetical protein